MATGNKRQTRNYGFILEKGQLEEGEQGKKMSSSEQRHQQGANEECSAESRGSHGQYGASRSLRKQKGKNKAHQRGKQKRSENPFLLITCQAEKWWCLPWASGLLGFPPA